jgi:hypothetical protein
MTDNIQKVRNCNKSYTIVTTVQILRRYFPFWTEPQTETIAFCPLDRVWMDKRFSSLVMSLQLRSLKLCRFSRYLTNLEQNQLQNGVGSVNRHLSPQVIQEGKRLNCQGRQRQIAQNQQSPALRYRRILIVLIKTTALRWTVERQLLETLTSALDRSKQSPLRSARFNSLKRAPVPNAASLHTRPFWAILVKPLLFKHPIHKKKKVYVNFDDSRIFCVAVCQKSYLLLRLH